MRLKLLAFVSFATVLVLALVAGIDLGNERSRVTASLIGYEETPGTISTPANGTCALSRALRAIYLLRRKKRGGGSYSPRSCVLRNARSGRSPTQ